MAATLLCASIVPAVAGVLPFAIAQEEEASLGEEETLADSIVSNVLDDQNVAVVDQDNTAEQDAANLDLQDQIGTQEEELAQDATNTNVDSDVLKGEQSPLTEPPTRPEEPPRPPTPPPDDDGLPTPPVEPPVENGKIAFSGLGNDNRGEIYVMNADGSDRTRLTNNFVNDFDPSWSPDGTKIAFIRDTDGSGSNWEIYVMNADDGSG